MIAKHMMPAACGLFALSAIALQVSVPKGLHHSQDEALAVAAFLGSLGAIWFGALNFRKQGTFSLVWVVLGILLLLMGFLLPSCFPARAMG